MRKGFYFTDNPRGRDRDDDTILDREDCSNGGETEAPPYQEEEEIRRRKREHTFEYVGPHTEAGGIVGMVWSFWYHLVVARLMGGGM